MSQRARYTGEISFLIGLGIGLGLGMFFNPWSGEANRRLLRDKAQKGQDLVKSGLDQGQDFIGRQGTELLDRVNEQIDRAANALTEQKDQLTGAVKAGIEAYSKTVGTER